MVEDLLKRIDYDIKIDSSIYYFNNKIVPRVTDILSKTIHEDYLMKWANSLGFRRLSYVEELNKAALCGTIAHNAIEQYLQQKEEFDPNKHENNTPFQSFLLWWEDITRSNDIEIVGQEEQLTCEWFGGTYDLLLKINGKTYLVDFKTSNHVSYKYFLQLAAYRYMLYRSKGINIDGCLILQLGKQEIMFKEYVLDFSNTEHYYFIEQCAQAFMSLVYAYYNTFHVKELYKTIF